MGSRYGILFFILLGLYSCQTNPPKPSILLSDETDSLELQFDKPSVTPVFLSLIKYLDSVGYIYDTARYYPKSDTLLWVDNYAVFSPNTEDVVLKRDDVREFYQNIGDDDVNALNKYIKDYDETLLLSVNKIYTYYSRVKQAIVYDDGAKWWFDGTVEEWQFTTPEQAKKVAEMYSKYESVLFFKVGAYIVVVNNCMYVFTSRAAGFVHLQKKHFKWLLKTYGGVSYLVI